VLPFLYGIEIMMKIESDPEKIKILAQNKEDENWEFRSFLKNYNIASKQLDAVVYRLNEEISSKIDCTECANCCREVLIELDRGDIKTMSKAVNLSESLFIEKYLTGAENSDRYIFSKQPCPFLRDNLCAQYEYRPEGCRSYPHLHKDEIVYRLITVIGNCSICPIVYNVYEQLKDQEW
jgi:Fe-S-cluster containining protein